MAEELTTSTDPLAEINAIKAVAEALEAIDTHAQIRVLRWASERFGKSPGAHQPEWSLDMLQSSPPAYGSSIPDPEYASAAEFLAATGAVSEQERVLAIGYWFQELQGLPDLESQQVSTELKHAGHRVSNITRAFSKLMAQKPQLVTQIRKAGNTKQARKKFRLTSAGVSRIKAMLQGGDDADD